MSFISKPKAFGFLYVKYLKKTVNNRHYTIVNPAVLIKSSGTIKLSNGQLLPFDRHNKNDIVNITIFALENGIIFGSRKDDWKLYLSKGIIETPSGIRFNITNFDPTIMSETFLNDIHFIDFDLRGKVVIDAGGFIGDTALYYADKGAKVYSFEPNTILYENAISNLKLNSKISKRVSFENYALGKDGIATFPVNPDGSVGSSIYESNTKQKLEVKSLSITAVLKKYKINSPYLLHLDVKGSEFELINDPSISKFQRVRIEYSPYLIKGGNNKNNKLAYLTTRLKRAGFNKMRVYKHNYLRYDLSYHGTIDAAK